MDCKLYLTWEEAQVHLSFNETLMFHHNGKSVPVDRHTNFYDLQWKHFGAFGLTWEDIYKGKYSLK